jgi:hypothetical protein
LPYGNRTVLIVKAVLCAIAANNGFVEADGHGELLIKPGINANLCHGFNIAVAGTKGTNIEYECCVTVFLSPEPPPPDPGGSAGVLPPPPPPQADKNDTNTNAIRECFMGACLS